MEWTTLLDSLIINNAPPLMNSVRFSMLNPSMQSDFIRQKVQYFLGLLPLKCNNHTLDWKAEVN